MLVSTPRWRVTRRRDSAWSAACGQIDDLLGRGDVQGGEDVALGLGEVGGLAEGAGRAGVGDGVQAAQFLAQAVPGLAGGGLGDADQEQGEPAEHDVSAYAVLAAVVDRSEIN